MKTAHASCLGRRATWTLGVLLVFACQAVQACPGCKQNTDGANAVPLNGDSIGFGISIFFMLFMITALIGGLGWMMYRSCRTLAARDAKLSAELETEEVPAPARRVVDVTPSAGGWVGGLAHGHS